VRYKQSAPLVRDGIFPAFFDIPQTCHILGCGETKVRDLNKDGWLDFRKEPGRSGRNAKTYVTFQSVKRYIEAMGGSIEDIVATRSVPIEELTQHIDIKELIGGDDA
jgi:hypothetical protein